MIIKLYDNKGLVKEVIDISKLVIEDNVGQPLAIYIEKNSTIIGTKIGDKDFEQQTKSLSLYRPTTITLKELK